MAENNEKLRDEVLSIIECSICTDILRDHRMLPCSHSFCLSCLQQWTETKRRPDDMSLALFAEVMDTTSIPCPMCRQPFKIPIEGLSKLKSNYIINQLIDASGTQQKEETKEVKTLEDLESDDHARQSRTICPEDPQQIRSNTHSRSTFSTLLLGSRNTRDTSATLRLFRSNNSDRTPRYSSILSSSELSTNTSYTRTTSANIPTQSASNTLAVASANVVAQRTSATATLPTSDNLQPQSTSGNISNSTNIPPQTTSAAVPISANISSQSISDAVSTSANISSQSISDTVPTSAIIGSQRTTQHQLSSINVDAIRTINPISNLTNRTTVTSVGSLRTGDPVSRALTAGLQETANPLLNNTMESSPLSVNPSPCLIIVDSRITANVCFADVCSQATTNTFQNPFPASVQATSNPTCISSPAQVGHPASANPMPSSSNVGSQAAANISSSSNVGSQAAANISSSSNVGSQAAANISSSSNVGSQAAANISSSSNVGSQAAANISSSSNVGSQAAANISSSSNVGSQAAVNNNISSNREVLLADLMQIIRQNVNSISSFSNSGSRANTRESQYSPATAIPVLSSTQESSQTTSNPVLSSSNIDSQEDTKSVSNSANVESVAAANMARSSMKVDSPAVCNPSSSTHPLSFLSELAQRIETGAKLKTSAKNDDVKVLRLSKRPSVPPKNVNRRLVNEQTNHSAGSVGINAGSSNLDGNIDAIQNLRSALKPLIQSTQNSAATSTSTADDTGSTIQNLRSGLKPLSQSTQNLTQTSFSTAHDGGSAIQNLRARLKPVNQPAQNPYSQEGISCSLEGEPIEDNTRAKDPDDIHNFRSKLKPLNESAKNSSCSQRDRSILQESESNGGNAESSRSNESCAISNLRSRLKPLSQSTQNLTDNQTIGPDALETNEYTNSSLSSNSIPAEQLGGHIISRGQQSTFYDKDRRQTDASLTSISQTVKKPSITRKPIRLADKPQAIPLLEEKGRQLEERNHRTEACECPASVFNPIEMNNACMSNKDDDVKTPMEFTETNQDEELGACGGREGRDSQNSRGDFSYLSPYFPYYLSGVNVDELDLLFGELDEEILADIFRNILSARND